MFATTIDGHTVTADTAKEMSELLRIEADRNKDAAPGLGEKLADKFVEDCKFIDDLVDSCTAPDKLIKKVPVVGGVETHDKDQKQHATEGCIIVDKSKSRIVCDICRQEAKLYASTIVCGCSTPREVKKAPDLKAFETLGDDRAAFTVRNNVRYEATGPGTFARVQDEPQISNIKLPDVKVDATKINAPGQTLQSRIPYTSAFIVRDTVNNAWVRRQSPGAVSWCLEQLVHTACPRIAQRLCTPKATLYVLRFHDTSPDIWQPAELAWPSEVQARALSFGTLMLRSRVPIDAPVKTGHSQAVPWTVRVVRLACDGACFDEFLVAVCALSSSIRYGLPVSDDERQRIEDGYGVFVPFFNYDTPVVVDVPAP